MKRNSILCMDALEGLRGVSSDSVDMVITSPPYWNLRDYHVKGQIGLEQDIAAYLERLLKLFDEVKRVLKPEGTCWVNFGDSYGAGQPMRPGANGVYPGDVGYLPKQPEPKSGWAKSLMGVPERFMLNMMDRGWTLRNKIIWHKPNHMPSSVKDRLACSWEYVFMFSKSRKYYFDLDAIRLPAKSAGKPLKSSGKNADVAKTGILNAATAGLYESRKTPIAPHPMGRNPGDCWNISTQPFRGAHFATFPERLVEQAVKTSPKWICKKCDIPRKRITHTVREDEHPNISEKARLAKTSDSHIGQPAVRYTTKHTTIGWTDCKCGAGFDNAVVMDIFMGAGTTAVVAQRLGRDYLGFELNPEYVKIAEQRLDDAQEKKKQEVV